jgi:hypothetical protein
MKQKIFLYIFAEGIPHVRTLTDDPVNPQTSDGRFLTGLRNDWWSLVQRRAAFIWAKSRLGT